MALLDLLRPQWKHSDPEKRLEAVHLLEDDRQEVFLSAALEDPDAGVRLAATRRLIGEANLRAALEKSSDAAVTGLLRGELVKIVAAWAGAPDAPTDASPDASMEKARAWIDELRALEAPEKTFGELAVGAPSLAVRRAALSGLSHASSFLAVALKEEDAALGLKALECLAKESHLDAAARNAKCREVRAAAKERLRALQDAKKPDEAALNRARLRVLVSTIEKAEEGARDPRHGFDWESARARVDEAAAALEELLATGVTVAETQRTQLEESLREFRNRYAAHAANEAARRESEAAHDTAHEAERDAEEHRRKQREREDADLRAGRENRERREKEAAAEAAETAARAAREEQRREEQVRRTEEREALRQRKEEAAAALEAIAAELEAIVAEADFKGAEKRLRDLRERGGAAAAFLGRDPGNTDAVARFQAAAGRLRDTLDWNQWAHLRHKQEMDQERQSNLEKKTALCERVEKLGELPGDKERHACVLEAQARWKETGPVAREHADALWERFRKPIDAFFEEHRQRIAADRERFEEGIRVREDICAEAGALQGMDRREAAEKVRTLQAQWKAAPPAPRKIEQELWSRFRKACDQFFAGNAR